LGAPGSTAPSLFELADPRIKRSKRSDGFYGWHIHGALSRLKFDPSSTDGPAAGKSRGKGDSPFSTKKPSLAVGTSTARDGKDEEATPRPAIAEPKAAEPKAAEPKAVEGETAPPAVPERVPPPPPSDAPPPGAEDGPAPRNRPAPETQ
jgi:hypothetical protein